MYNYETRKLTFQFVPEHSWYKNLHNFTPRWNEISEKIRETNKCEICGKETHDLDAHEVWTYNDITHTQSLDNIIAVCKDCHNTIHIGHANITGKTKEAIAQYKKVNQLTDAEINKDYNEAVSVWEIRSGYEWTIDEEQIKQKVYEQTGIKCDMDINGKYYVNISYAEKEKAKQYGAKWDWQRKMWYFTDMESRNNWSNRVR